MPTKENELMERYEDLAMAITRQAYVDYARALALKTAFENENRSANTRKLVETTRLKIENRIKYRKFADEDMRKLAFEETLWRYLNHVYSLFTE